jgi:predicted acetyltransferase
MRFTVGEALWVRLVDVGAALVAVTSARVRSSSTFTDEFCPWNQARWRVEGGAADRTTAEADLRLGVSELGSVYLGGSRSTSFGAPSG